jgi:hypothetical protein
LKTLDDRGLKQPYPTCDLLALLHSASVKDRAASIAFMPNEKGVLEVLLRAMRDDDSLEVVSRASRAFAIMTGQYGQQQVFPDVDDLQKWWAKEGAAIEAKFKPAATCAP